MVEIRVQDILDERRFKNTTKVNIRNYETLLGGFVNYCIEKEVVSVEDITYSHIKRRFHTLDFLAQ